MKHLSHANGLYPSRGTIDTACRLTVTKKTVVDNQNCDCPECLKIAKIVNFRFQEVFPNCHPKNLPYQI